MKYSIVSVKNLNNEYRLDAEYFSPEILVVEKNISKHKTEIISNFARVIHPTEIERIYIDSGLKMILAQNVRSNSLCMDLKFCMSQNLQNILSNNLLDYDDVLITRTGANFGQTAPFKFKDKMYACADLLVVKCNQILGGYLSTFLNTKYGRLILDRGVYGAAQPHISASYIKQLKIPRFTQNFERLIDNLLNKTFNNNILLEKFYYKAKNILLEELNIENWTAKHKLCSVKNYSDVKNANRLDAEYFQPKYDEIIEKINKYPNGWDTIGNQFKQNKKSFLIDLNSEYKYVEIGSINIANGEIIPENILGENLPANAKINLQQYDILISKVRTYRGAVAIVKSLDYVGSGAFTVLHEKLNSKINKETLYVYFKLKPILDLTLKYNTGSSYPTITDEDILNMPIPIFQQEIQNSVKNNIQQAQKIQAQSKQLLEIAKRGVEIAIEQDENIATNWINQELQKIGVEL